MKFALTTAAAALLTATTAFAAGVEGQGPAEGLNIAPTTGESIVSVVRGPVGDNTYDVRPGDKVTLNVFETVKDTKSSGGSYYR